MKLTIFLIPFLLGKIHEKKLAVCYFHKMEAFYFFGGRDFQCDQVCHKIIKKACKASQKCKEALHFKKLEERIKNESNRKIAAFVKDWYYQKCFEQN